MELATKKVHLGINFGWQEDTWLDGSNIIYTNWADGEPDTDAHVSASLTNRHRGLWKTRRRDNTGVLLCQRYDGA